MAVEQRISEVQYQQFVLARPDGPWELHDVRLEELVHRSGTVTLVALPGIEINLDELFDV